MCVVDPQDPAAIIANQLLDMYPSVDAKLFLGIWKYLENKYYVQTILTDFCNSFFAFWKWQNVI